MKKEYIVLKGVFCGACSYAIEKAGRKLNAVNDIRVDVAKAQVIVTYDGSAGVMEQVLAIVEKLGHEGTIAGGCDG